MSLTCKQVKVVNYRDILTGPDLGKGNSSYHVYLK